MSELHRSRNAGFSLVELLIVISLLTIVIGIAVLNTGSAVPNMRANAAMNQVVAQVRMGRESALAQRRNFQILFLGSNQIQLRRLEVDPAPPTDFPPVTLTGGVQFTLFSAMPDTPDDFGNTTAVSFGGSPTLTFLSDGTFVDSSGAPLNGTVFIGIPGRTETARAITVLGTTGRVGRYRWDGSRWIN